jgi:hypothetical protein
MVTRTRLNVTLFIHCLSCSCSVSYFSHCAPETISISLTLWSLIVSNTTLLYWIISCSFLYEVLCSCWCNYVEYCRLSRDTGKSGIYMPTFARKILLHLLWYKERRYKQHISRSNANILKTEVKVKVKVSLEQTMKSQRGSRGIAVLFL